LEEIRFCCASCGHLYRLKRDRIPPEGARADCQSCGVSIAVFPDGTLEGAVPAEPGSPLPDSPPAAPPRPSVPPDGPPPDAGGLEPLPDLDDGLSLEELPGEESGPVESTILSPEGPPGAPRPALADILDPSDAQGVSRPDGPVPKPAAPVEKSPSGGGPPVDEGDLDTPELPAAEPLGSLSAEPAGLSGMPEPGEVLDAAYGELGAPADEPAPAPDLPASGDEGTTAPAGQPPAPETAVPAALVDDIPPLDGALLDEPPLTGVEGTVLSQGPATASPEPSLSELLESQDTEAPGEEPALPDGPLEDVGVEEIPPLEGEKPPASADTPPPETAPAAAPEIPDVPLDGISVDEIPPIEAEIQAPPPPAPPPPDPDILQFCCAGCGHLFKIPRNRIPVGGAKAPCKSCGAPISVYPDGNMEGAVPAVPPPPASPPAPPETSQEAAPPPKPPADPHTFEFRCPSCGHRHKADLTKLPPEGMKGPCARCQEPLHLLPDGTVRGKDAPPPDRPETPLLGTGEEPMWELQSEEDIIGPFPLRDVQDLIKGDNLAAGSQVRPVGGAWGAVAAFAAFAHLFAPEQDDEESFGDEGRCFAHPNRLPDRQCSQCGRYLCPECQKPHQSMGSRKQIMLCVACGGTTVEIKRRRKWTPFYMDMKNILLLPFTGGAALMYFATLSVMQLLKIPCGFAAGLGTISIFVLTVFQFSFYLHVIRGVANGSYELPEWPDMSNFNDMMFDTLKVFLFVYGPPILGIVFFGAAALSGNFMAAGLSAIAMVVLFPFLIAYYLFYLPVILMVFAIFSTILPAFNPFVIFKVIMRIGPKYLLAVLLWASFKIIEKAVGGAMPPMNLFGMGLHAILIVYTNLLICYTLGRVAYENEENIGWY